MLPLDMSPYTPEKVIAALNVLSEKEKALVIHVAIIVADYAAAAHKEAA